MNPNKRSTALALASLTSTAAAADGYYEIDFTVTSSSGVTPPGTLWRGWFVTDDALALSVGSATIASYEFEMSLGGGPQFGTSFGNELIFPTGHPLDPVRSFTRGAAAAASHSRPACPPRSATLSNTHSSSA